MFILFQTDQWHSNSSKEVLGLFGKAEYAIESLKSHLNKTLDDNQLSSYDERNLLFINQTQGRDINYLLEEYKTNTILI
jgi:hypothetical protein